MTARKIEPNETIDLTDLTSEIALFIRTGDADKEKLESMTIETDEPEIEIPRHGQESLPRHGQDFHPQRERSEQLTIEKIENLGETESNEVIRKSPVEIIVRAPTDEETGRIKLNAEIVTSHIVENKQIQTVAESLESINQTSEDDLEEFQNNSKNLREMLTSPETAVKANNRNNGKHIHKYPVIELKISESFDDLTVAENVVPMGFSVRGDIGSSGSVDTTKGHSIPIELDSPEKLKKQFQFCDIKKQQPTPHKRRSVNDIIDSINKCQSLLNVNQGFKANKVEKDEVSSDIIQAPPSYFLRCNNSFHDTNMQDPYEKGSIFQHEQIFSHVPETNNSANEEDMSNIPLFVEKFNELNHMRLFEKCNVRHTGEISNVEWNPLPKPRRHRDPKQGPID